MSLGYRQYATGKARELILETLSQRVEGFDSKFEHKKRSLKTPFASLGVSSADIHEAVKAIEQATWSRKIVFPKNRVSELKSASDILDLFEGLMGFIPLSSPTFEPLKLKG